MSAGDMNAKSFSAGLNRLRKLMQKWNKFSFFKVGVYLWQIFFMSVTTKCYIFFYAFKSCKTKCKTKREEMKLTIFFLLGRVLKERFAWKWQK